MPSRKSHYYLEDCPFCHSKDVEITRLAWGKQNHVVECQNCLALGPQAISEMSAAILWNLAVREPRYIREIARMRGE